MWNIPRCKNLPRSLSLSLSYFCNSFILISIMVRWIQSLSHNAVLHKKLRDTVDLPFLKHFPHSFLYHCYADDTQLQLFGFSCLGTRISKRLADVSSWMAACQLNLNPIKTKLVYIPGDASTCHKCAEKLSHLTTQKEMACFQTSSSSVYPAFCSYYGAPRPLRCNRLLLSGLPAWHMFNPPRFFSHPPSPPHPPHQFTRFPYMPISHLSLMLALRLINGPALTYLH